MDNNLIAVFSTAVTNPEFNSELTEWRNKIQDFNVRLNSDVESEKIMKKQGQEYLPISYVETTLDELFFGHWMTENFKYQQVANEIIGSITLSVLHPISGVWIKREGAGAVQIMQDAGSTIDSIMQTKKKNALETCFPKLKAQCVKNACKSIGKYFGRDIARKVKDTYQPLQINSGDWSTVLALLSNYNGEDKEQLISEAQNKKVTRKLTIEYVRELSEKVMNGNINS